MPIWMGTSVWPRLVPADSKSMAAKEVGAINCTVKKGWGKAAGLARMECGGAECQIIRKINCQLALEGASGNGFAR